ncbi:MAG: hypothetical protein GF330_03450 [Candidatus Eisenbacteria bacterium]|nr:hypothetical protein [Candidatus Eisenbacteria bacterium]
MRAHPPPRDRDTRLRKRRTVRGWACGVALVCILCSLAPARATAHDPERYWTLNTALLVELHLYEPSSGDPLDPAQAGAASRKLTGEVFDSPDFQQMLLWFPNRETSYLLDLASGDACAYPRADLAGNPTPGAHPVEPPAGSGERLGSFFTQPDGSLAFSTPSADLLVRPAPELVGELPRAEIEARLPGFASKVAAYEPSAAALTTLRTIATPTEIVAFFGTWCTACREELPALAKTLDAAHNPHLSLRMVGVDEYLAEPHELLIALEVSDVPTILVRQEGVELGRIVDAPRRSVEAHLAELLAADPRR